jgi:2-aminoadipate transaminase
MTNHEQFLSRSALTMRESAIRQMGAVLAQASDMVSFAPGYPAEDVFPWEAFAEIARELLTGRDGSVLQYGPTRGFKPLGDVSLEIMKMRGITSRTDQLVVTTGSQQGLDLIGRVLLDPGDVALMELPSYTGAITAFRNTGASLVGIRQQPDGIDLDHLDATVRKLRSEGRRIKFLYLVPNFQNPSGLLIGLEKRARLLEWAEQQDVLIVEDDPYRDLYFPDVTREEETRPIAAIDASRVIYLSSFSKTLAPGFRVGWLSAPAPVAAKLELAKQAEDLCTGGLDQRVVYEACRRGLLARHLPVLRAYYQQKRDTMSRALEARLSEQLGWVPPRGGFFLWAELGGNLTSDRLLSVARQRGVIFVTGAAFFVDGTGDRFLRLCFSSASLDRIEEGVKRLADAVEEASHAPADRRVSSI